MLSFSNRPFVNQTISKYMSDSTNKSMEKYQKQYQKQYIVEYINILPFVSLFSFLAGYHFCKLVK
jgi:hypothetical protein